MRSRFLIVLLLCVPGCGGDAEVPAGYTTYERDGVSFVHPEGWRASTESLGDGITEVRFQDPDASGPERAAVSFTVQPGVGERFDSQIEGERTVLESAGGAEVTQEDADVPGASKAVRSTIESDGAKSEAVDVLDGDGRHVALAAGGPEGELGPLDPEAVIGSLRVGE